MTLYFPDLNVWVALTVVEHSHSQEAWSWLGHLPQDSRLAFSRFTQIGLLRLLANPAAMGGQALTLGDAWKAYDRWLGDPRVEFYPEPRGADELFRSFMAPFAAQQASKAVGDCWLLAHATALGATLATFDRALLEFSRRQGHTAILPS